MQGPWVDPPAPPLGWQTPPRRRSSGILVVIAVVLIAALVGGVLVRSLGPVAPRAPGSPVLPARSAGVDLRITGSAPETWDPALQGDASTSRILAQVYEGLTVFDADSRVQPALARSWSIEDGGRRIVFTLREGLHFSDGRPIVAQDVVASWLRLIDPARPSPLSSLLADVRGATDYLRGSGTRDAVGLRADGDRTVVVEFRRPASYFLGTTASPSLAVVPTDTGDAYRNPALPAAFVASGGYVPVTQTETTITLHANPNYWAGEPPLKTIELVTDLQGASGSEAFASGDLDYVSLDDTPGGAVDATWLRYDPKLGPQLRRTDIFSVQYYGFDTRKPPFDDARIRRAFAEAIDWDRLVQVSGGSNYVVATSLVPAGITAAGDADYSPPYDPPAARALLTDAGYPGGAGFPEVTLGSDGGPNVAIARELKAQLGVTVHVEEMGGPSYFQRIRDDPPAFWSLVWIADYPAAHDFLGLLLETGSSNNYSSWSSADFDAALEAAAATDDPAQQALSYDAAQRIVQQEVPVIPVSYLESWALSKTGLQGAAESGLGLQRFAGMSWAAGQ